MKLEQQVCTLEQAKRLKELGINQTSFFSWFNATDRDDEPALNLSSKHACPMCRYPITSYYEEVSAFTVADLGQMLPKKIRINSADYTFRINREKSGIWILKYRTRNREYKMIPLIEQPGCNEAQVRAIILIKLLINKFITAEEVNKRLQP